MSKIENVVRFMEQIAADDSHGYAQDNRNGSPDYDCSSFVGTALSKAGFKVSPASTTRNLYKQLIDCGFKEIGVNDAKQRGDIFLTPGKHVVVCTNANQIVHASINENGKVSGGKSGDQTGKEICTRSFYIPSYGWTYHLRFEEVTSTEIKGIDVSAYQGTIDWGKVKADGIEFAILRGITKNGKLDTTFETNYNNATANGVSVIGVYHFSYSLNEQTAINDASNMIAKLNGKKLPIYLDLEWSSQRALGKAKVTSIAKAYVNRCKELGYTCHIYSNLDWYKNVYNAKELSALGCKFWIARYPSDDIGVVKENLRPNIGEAIWQFSSKGKVAGVSGNVDMNVLYDSSLISSSTPTIKNVVKVDTTLNVRNTPNGTKVGSLKNGTEVDILDYKDGWFKIGANQWVSATYINNTHGRVTASVLNLRSDAGTNFADIGDLKNNTIVRITKEKNGWYQILADNKFGWVSAKYIDII